MPDPTSTSAVATAAARAPVLDDRRFFGHPRSLGLLFVVEMWERVSYYGMRAILVLYLVNALHWDAVRAAGLYGTYTMAVYLSSLPGGYLADRWIGTRRSLVLGGVLIAAGHFSLAFPSATAFYAGLALIVLGTGFFKPNAATMVGQMYRPGDARRDGGFTIYYMGVNVGAFIGPLVCGGLAQSDRFGWHWGFAAAGVGMVLGLVTYLWGRERYLPGIGLGVEHAATRDAARESGRGTTLHGAVGAAGGALVALAVSGASPIAAAIGGVVGATLGITFLGTHGDERKRVVALFIVVFFVIFFWAAYEQAGSSMNLFADKDTDLRVGGFDIPSSWFQSVNPFAILLFAPLFAALWQRLGARGKDPSTPLKMVLGLFLLGVGFLFMLAGGKRADAGVLVSPWWLTLAYLFHTLGELCLSPVGLSYVTKLAPARLASLLMGTFYLANAAANKVAGWLAGLTPLPGAARPPPAGGLTGLLQRVSATNAGFYSIFVVSSFGAAALMLLFVPLLKRLAAGADTPGGAAHG
jgi:POT family proton-dependent oligopeptide transporter